MEASLVIIHLFVAVVVVVVVVVFVDDHSLLLHVSSASTHQVSKQHDTIATPQLFVLFDLVVQLQFQCLCSFCISEVAEVVVAVVVVVVGSQVIHYRCHCYIICRNSHLLVE